MVGLQMDGATISRPERRKDVRLTDTEVSIVGLMALLCRSESGECSNVCKRSLDGRVLTVESLASPAKSARLVVHAAPDQDCGLE